MGAAIADLAQVAAGYRPWTLEVSTVAGELSQNADLAVQVDVPRKTERAAQRLHRRLQGGRSACCTLGRRQEVWRLGAAAMSMLKVRTGAAKRISCRPSGGWAGCELKRVGARDGH